MATRFSDSDLAFRVQATGDNEAMKEILQNHSGIYLKILDHSLPDDYAEKRELAQDREYKLYEYTMAYKPEKKMKLSTYFGQRIKWECMNIYNRSHRYNEEADENSLDCSYEQELENVNEEVLAEIFSLAENYSDSRASFIIKARYTGCKDGKNKSWKEVAEELGIKPAVAMNIQKKFLASIKKNLVKYI